MSELLLVNPRRRRRKSSRRRKGRMPPALAAYWASRRGRKRRKTRAPSRARARRRRHLVIAMSTPRRVRRRRIAINPRRRRSHARRFHSRRRHRNPRFGLPSARGIVKQTLMPAAIGATGALALDVAYGYASPYLPTVLQGKWATLGVKIVGALGIGMLASKTLGRERGRVATLGAVTVVAYGALKSALSQALPTVPGLSGYMDFVDYSMQSRAPGVGFYSPAAVIPPTSGTGAYLPPASPGVGAYMPAMHGMGDYSWQSDGM